LALISGKCVVDIRALLDYYFKMFCLTTALAVMRNCCSGPNSIAKSVVEPDSGGRYTVYYTPVEVGLYNISVKWNGKEIEGTLLANFFALFFRCYFGH